MSKVTEIEKTIEEIVDGIRHCYDTDEGFKRGCEGCPYANHSYFECRQYLNSDVLEFLKRRML